MVTNPATYHCISHKSSIHRLDIQESIFPSWLTEYLWPEIISYKLHTFPRLACTAVQYSHMSGKLKSPIGVRVAGLSWLPTEYLISAIIQARPLVADTYCNISFVFHPYCSYSGYPFWSACSSLVVQLITPSLTHIKDIIVLGTNQLVIWQRTCCVNSAKIN